MEFALVVIPLLMIVAGIINFGFVFAQQLALDNAVRAGARAGVVDTGNDPATVTQTEWEAAAIGRDLTSGFSVTYGPRNTCEDSTFGDSLIVKGAVNSRFIIPWPIPGVRQSVNLSSQAEFQCEYE
ncbi:hypothetical protein ASG76_09230 [Nocardioides sp. Soil774]|uniref:TadE/TadG family type IV pilus assembly protein n=1 Tax=Nocardioides sp. Soil774 TaxID=1736408 RepID=UPI0006FA224E|nr:TadE family protein [Nocardioides sp. Soil774]KRE94590.1 hypothetical protein ASG76_09230 [Nocardioides sp. Soil774]